MANLQKSKRWIRANWRHCLQWTLLAAAAAGGLGTWYVAANSGERFFASPSLVKYRVVSEVSVRDDGVALMMRHVIVTNDADTPCTDVRIRLNGMQVERRVWSDVPHECFGEDGTSVVVTIPVIAPGETATAFCAYAAPELFSLKTFDYFLGRYSSAEARIDAAASIVGDSLDMYCYIRGVTSKQGKIRRDKSGDLWLMRREDRDGIMVVGASDRQ